MRQGGLILLALLALLALPLVAQAGNKPCSQSKGGIAYCEKGKFICQDGSMSASRRVCIPEASHVRLPADSQKSPRIPQTTQLKGDTK